MCFRFTPGNCVSLARRNWTIATRTDNVVPHSPSEFSYHMRGTVKYVLVPAGIQKVGDQFVKKTDELMLSIKYIRL